MQRCFGIDNMLLKFRPLFFVVIAAMCATVAFQRNIIWSGRAAIWLDATQKSPRKARPHVNVGLFYDMTGDLDNAQYEYKIAIQVEPDYLSPYGPLAVIYGKKGDIDTAINMLLWVIERLPGKDPKLNTALGVAYRAKGMLKEAEIEFQKAIRINPYYDTAHYNLAQVYEEMGFKDEALQHYRSFIDTTIPNP